MIALKKSLTLKTWCSVIFGKDKNVVLFSVESFPLTKLMSLNHFILLKEDLIGASNSLVVHCSPR